MHLLLLLVIALQAAPQPKARRVFTNDDLERGRPQSSVPSIPGLVDCGADVQCFVKALDSATPAAVRRRESESEGRGGLLTMSSNSTWWTTGYTGARCTVSFRVDEFEEKADEKIFRDMAQAERDTVQRKIAEFNRGFETIRGQISTCNLAVKDLKAVMTSPRLSLLRLGQASNFGKDCTGPGFGSKK